MKMYITDKGSVAMYKRGVENIKGVTVVENIFGLIQFYRENEALFKFYREECFEEYFKEFFEDGVDGAIKVFMRDIKEKDCSKDMATLDLGIPSVFALIVGEDDDLMLKFYIIT